MPSFEYKQYEEEDSQPANSDGVIGLFLVTTGLGFGYSGYLGVDTFEAGTTNEAIVTLSIENDQTYITQPDLLFGGIALAGIAMVAAGSYKLGKGLWATRDKNGKRSVQ